jgi:hypothetical protein
VTNIQLNNQLIWDGTFKAIVTGISFNSEDNQYIKFNVTAGTWQFIAQGCTKVINPYVQVNAGTLVSSANASVIIGNSLVMAPQPNTGGSWSWTGPNAFTAITNSITLNNIQATQLGTYTATYSNDCGGKNSQDFNVCGPVAITSYITVNGLRSKLTTVTVNSGDKIILDPEPLTGGSWSWSGGGASGTFRSQTIYPFISGTATATYTNECGVSTTQKITINVPNGGFTIPGIIQAEAYTAMSGVSLETVADTGGGLDVGGITDGDWMDFPIKVPTSGSYKINFRVATPLDGGNILFMVNGVTQATIAVPNTTNWQKWATVSTTLPLSAGIQTIRLKASGSQWNINWWSVDTVMLTKISNAEAIKIYANFTNRLVIIKIGTNQASDIKIYDAKGSMVYSIYNVKTDLAIPFSKIGGNGIYFFKTNTGTQKLIIE